MLKRDLLRNVIIVAVLLAILVGLRLFVYTPYRITKQDANSFLAEDDLVLAEKTEKIPRGNLCSMKSMANIMLAASSLRKMTR